MAKQNQGRINVYEAIYGLTTPLITTASGAKMGKTAAGAVWLNADMLSPFDYWQFWRNTEDADVGRFLRLFTELPMEEIERLEALQGAEVNEAKKILATEATRLCHGDAAAQQAEQAARSTFGGSGGTAGLPEIHALKSELGALTVRALLMQAGFAASNGEARKLIEGGGVRLNDEPVTDPTLLLTPSRLLPDGTLKLSKGKKHHVLVRFS
jgi:tyrosyl-tRNA synthetase